MNKQISVNKFSSANKHPHFQVEKNLAIHFVIFDLTKTTISSPMIN